MVKITRKEVDVMPQQPTIAASFSQGQPYPRLVSLSHTAIFSFILGREKKGLVY